MLFGKPPSLASGPLLGPSSPAIITLGGVAEQASPGAWDDASSTLFTGLEKAPGEDGVSSVDPQGSQVLNEEAEPDSRV